jgi:hypothetical protein
MIDLLQPFADAVLLAVDELADGVERAAAKWRAWAWLAKSSALNWLITRKGW